MLEELLKPGMTGAPLLLEGLATFVGLTLATWFGKRQITQGKAEGRDPRPPMTFAGALISEKKADELISAFNKNTAALDSNTVVAGELKASLGANTTAAVSLGGELSDNRVELRFISQELAAARNRS